MVVHSQRLTQVITEGEEGPLKDVPLDRYIDYMRQQGWKLISYCARPHTLCYDKVEYEVTFESPCYYW